MPFDSIEAVIAGGFLCWLSGVGAGLLVRYFRYIITSATTN